MGDSTQSLLTKHVWSQKEAAKHFLFFMEFLPFHLDLNEDPHKTSRSSQTNVTSWKCSKLVSYINLLKIASAVVSFQGTMLQAESTKSHLTKHFGYFLEMHALTK